MDEEEMYQKYRKYIGSVNAALWDQMHEFVADPASFNGVLMTPPQYGETLAAFSRTCEGGLYVELLDVVIDAARGRIAAKLVASGKPVTEFFGMQPTGRSVRFNEVWLMLSGMIETS